nr:hypothetical protein [Tanacetum cinerariifolium]
MSTQQDIYAAGSKSRPPVLNKENYVPWSSRLLWYAKSRPNGKLIYNSILNGQYVRRMIPEPDDANREDTMTETFHVQTYDELSNKELKQIEADDQAIQTILFGLPEDIYAAIDSCETAQEIWLRTKELHTADYTQLYDFLKYNQKEVDELKAERLTKTQDPLALMANSNNSYAFPTPHQDQSSFNQNYLQQPMLNPEDITDPITAMNIQMQMVGGNGGNQFRQYVGQNAGNMTGYNDVIGNQIGNGNLVTARAEGNTAGPRRRDAAYLQTQLLIAQKEEAEIQLQAEEYDLMAAAADIDEIEEVNANCILMANLHCASLAKHKALELEIERLLKAVVSQDIMIIVLNYAKENAHLKATYKNLLDSISVSRTQTKTIIASLQNELQSTIYKNAKLRTQLFKKVSDQKDNTHDTSENTKFTKQPIIENLPKVGESHALLKPVTSNSVSTPQESKGVDNTKTIRPPPRSNTKNDRVPSACTSNPVEPTIKWFLNATFSLAGDSNMFMVRRLGLFQAHDKKSKASHQFRLKVLGNCSLQKRSCCCNSGFW